MSLYFGPVTLRTRTSPDLPTAIGKPFHHGISDSGTRPSDYSSPPVHLAEFCCLLNNQVRESITESSF